MDYKKILIILLLVVVFTPCALAKTHLPDVMTAEEMDMLINSINTNACSSSTYINFTGSVTGTLYCHNYGPSALDAISGSLVVYEQQEDGMYMKVGSKPFSDTLLPVGSTKLCSYYKAYYGCRLAYFTTVTFTEDGYSETVTGGRYYPE